MESYEYVEEDGVTVSGYASGFRAALAAAAGVADRVRQKYGYDATTAHVIWADILDIEVPE